MTPKMFALECMMKEYNSYLTYPPLETSLPVWNRIKSDVNNENKEEDDELVLKRKTPFYDEKSSLDSIWRINSIQ
jgi:hypothetical protein